ncbi:hypothetical protein DL768_011522 [Monosporascus sp. mg162]|nr:hypothetical protein DL768_011522 [Monosporascus sp. mg162]
MSSYAISMKNVVLAEGNLNGPSASELLYEIIQGASLANDTFYKNKEHIASLFKAHKFFLHTGGSLLFDLNLDRPGTICAFFEGIPGGGLDLSQIRSLWQVILDKECSKRG